MNTPLSFIVVCPVLTVVALTVSALTVLAVTLFKPFKSLAKRTFKLSLPSDTTPKLSSVVNLEASVTPPYFIPSSMVAISCFLPFSSMTIRVILVPSTEAVASPLLIEVPFSPSLPFNARLSALRSLSILMVKLPFASTEAVIFSVSTKSKPSASLTVFAFAPFAL